IGETNAWDAHAGGGVPLMGWTDILALQERGFRFGAHGCTHRPLTDLGDAEIVREASRSRAVLIRGLGRAVTAFAYPYSEVDPAIERLVGACGYEFAVTGRGGPATIDDDLLDTPRIEIDGSLDLERFIARLPAE